ncbi:multicomponent Na+:H+ antiporter subunit F [Lipingzhangella halophila]|uniref:Multicomponent Na+:H+ antiporter subunit F n=1 Tax=Lipingzhangella halophila TaxID=1783352 RepID=A0A7W7W0B2_9ACTN|nr:monovalent cation/H+ antiporter complex subunit F [Lipingzhangella halophila]MBB4929431.1 multicomponent Na+:H+ antiporter subunit F [Lipingzhangella halophila]
MTLIDIPIVALGAVIVMVAVRMFIGPSRADRAAAADLGFFCFIALAALFGVRMDLPGVFDVILIATLTGFVGTLWMARLISRVKGSTNA